MAGKAPDEPLRALGAVVRALRITRGLTQERLAEGAGLHTTYVSDIERGRRNVGFLNRCLLARALEVDLPTLMTEVETERHR